MCKKYVLLAVCLALVVTLIHAPDSCGKVRAAKTFDGKVWVKIDEVDGHNWDEVAIIHEHGQRGNRQLFLICTPFFSFNFGLTNASHRIHMNNKELYENRIRAIEQKCHKWRSRFDRRFN